MKVTVSIEGGSRVAFDNVEEEALQSAILVLAQPQGLVWTPYKGPVPVQTSVGEVSERSLNAPLAPPVRPKGVSKRAIEILLELLADGEWHSKDFVVKAWEREGLRVKTCELAIRRVERLHRSRRGGRAWWRLELEPEPESVLPAPTTESRHLGAFGENGARPLNGAAV